LGGVLGAAAVVGLGEVTAEEKERG
jgi:hypothetical protein